MHLRLGDTRKCLVTLPYSKLLTTFLDQREYTNEYLNNKFPHCAIQDRYDFDRISQIFRVECASSVYFLIVSREFLDDHSNSEISRLMEKYSIADVLKTSGGTRVLLTNSGVRVEGETKKHGLEIAHMIRYLESKWGERPCPMCEKRQWSITDSVYELKAHQKGAFLTDGFVVPVVLVVCNNCGNTVLVNAITAGIVKTDRKD